MEIAARQRSRRQSDLAYAGIISALFSGTVKFGSFIAQSELTERTGFGVGPVRDALKVLEADGIIVIHPRSGIEILPRSTELARSTFQFRSIIERFAVRQFTLTAARADIDAMIALHEGKIAGLAGLPPDIDMTDTLNEAEVAFHLPIIASLSNAIVDSAYRRLGLLSQIVKMNAHVSPQAAETSLSEHLDVLRAVGLRDPDQAETAIVRHLTNALQRNLGLI